ncbi:MAG: hypothetical protein V1846_00190 [Candidatus Komeilibacteria bacterium]
MKPFYKQVVANAWSAALNKRWLWPLAFFASFLGLSSTFQIFFDIMPQDNGLVVDITRTTSQDFLTANFVGWSNGFYQIPWTRVTFSDIPLLALIIILLFIILGLTVIVISAQGGLIHGLAATFSNRRSDFFTSFRAGLDRFWEIFVVNFCYRLIYLFFLGAIILPLMIIASHASRPWTLFWSIIIFFIALPAIIILDIVARFTVMQVVLAKGKLTKAIRTAWDLFKANWLISIETSLLIFALLFVLVVIILIIFYLLLMLFVFFVSLMPVGTIFFQIVLFTGLIVALVIVVVAFILFTTFQLGIWTEIFQRINREQHFSKVHRAVSQLPLFHKKLF